MSNELFALVLVVFAGFEISSCVPLGDSQVPWTLLNPSLKFGGARLQTYKYTNCGNASDLANLTELVLSPDPLHFPGELNVEFSVDIKQAISQGLKGNVLMTKRLGKKWIKIPCIDNIGSCTYDDICSLLEQIPQCPQQFVDAGIPCKCPFPAAKYQLPTASFEVDAAIFPAGDIHVIAHLQFLDKPVACADIYATFT